MGDLRIELQAPVLIATPGNRQFFLRKIQNFGRKYNFVALPRSADLDNHTIS